MANFCILVSDSNGQVIKVIGDGKGNGPSQFSQPAGITLDDYGNVIVAGKLFTTISTYLLNVYFYEIIQRLEK